MDIINELEIGNIENNFQDSIEYIEEQKKIWAKKSHIFNVIRLANAIEQLQQEEIFKNDGVEYIAIDHENNSTTGNFLMCNFFNSKGHIEKRVKGKDIESYTKIRDYINSFDNFDDKNIQTQDFEGNIFLKDDIRKQIFNVLLSKELRTVIGYSEMQLELKNGITPQTKKLKL
jgi:hypothetical protein